MIAHLMCPGVVAALSSRVESAKAVAGQTFTFRTVAAVPATRVSPEIPARTPGYGIIAFADHARGGGTPGRIVLEPRYLRLADGTHVQVIADTQYTDEFMQGGTGNLAGPLSYVPGVGGLAVGGFNALHHGKETTAGRGMQLHLLVGDGLASGGCRVPPP